VRGAAIDDSVLPGRLAALYTVVTEVFNQSLAHHIR